MLRRMKSIGPRLLTTLLWLLTGQSGWCVETTHDFTKWEKEISAFETSDATNPPAKGILLFTGSMTIANWKSLGHDFPGQPLLNRAFGGSEIVDATHFADRIIYPYAPRKIFLRAGGNELWAGKSPQQVFADFEDFVTHVHAKLPSAEIAFISLSPSVARWTQRDLEKDVNTMVANYVARKPYLRYIETYDLPLDADGRPRPELFLADQLHFSPACYQLLAARVRPFVTNTVSPK